MYFRRNKLNNRMLIAVCWVGLLSLLIGPLAGSTLIAETPQPAPLPAMVSGATPINGVKEGPKPASESSPKPAGSDETPAASPEVKPQESPKSGDPKSDDTKSAEGKPNAPAAVESTPKPAKEKVDTGEQSPANAPAPGEKPSPSANSESIPPQMTEKPKPEGTADTSQATPAKIQATSSHGADDELTGNSQGTSSNGFRDLVIGDSLAGWTTIEGKSECWEIVDGVIKCVRPGGGWLRTNQEYSDFTLRFECRIAEGANTGIGFRFPSTGSPTMTGFEVQLLDDTSQKYENLRPDQYNGSLYYFQSPDTPTQLKVGEWNECEVSCKGGDVRVTINGTVSTSTSLLRLVETKWHPFSQRPTTGHIGLQSSSQPVEYRHLRLQEHGRKTESGVTIVELTEGDGPEVPSGSTITVHYTGQLLDGKIFDSSLERGAPVTASLSRVIPGWRDGMAGMKAGGRRRLIIPSGLAYGEKGVGEIIPPNSTLVFEVELRHFEQ